MQYRPHRYNTQYPVELATATGRQQANVIDVHNAGARIEGLRDARRGDKIKVKILSCQVDAIVQWVSGSRAGLTFRPQISDDQVDTLRYRQDKRPGSHRGAVGFGFAEMR